VTSPADQRPALLTDAVQVLDALTDVPIEAEVRMMENGFITPRTVTTKRRIW
jgi:hypothetical protein